MSVGAVGARRWLAGLIVVAVCLVPGTGLTQPTSGDRSIDAMERAVARRVNEIRREHDRPPLKVDLTLSRVARETACSLARRGMLTHESPSGDSVAARVQAAGKTVRMVGENLALNRNVRDPVATAVNGWMGSPGHRENVLHPTFTETGVGICQSGPTLYFTQVFLRPER